MCITNCTKSVNLKDTKTKMENSQLVDSILETVKQEVTNFVEAESSITCPIDYELRVIKIARTLAQEMISKSQGGLPKSRNSKKSFDYSR